MVDASDRTPAAREVLQWFEYKHLDGELREVSLIYAGMAEEMIDRLPDSLELEVGLRKLLEAKDAFVRCAVQKGRE